MGKSVMSKAVVFCTFAPMHSGHIDLIQRAKRMHDSVIVIVSGTELNSLVTIMKTRASGSRCTRKLRL